eukprot:7072650-Alexandrium_andersonii.AAC.1
MTELGRFPVGLAPQSPVPSDRCSQDGLSARMRLASRRLGGIRKSFRSPVPRLRGRGQECRQVRRLFRHLFFGPRYTRAAEASLVVAGRK